MTEWIAIGVTISIFLVGLAIQGCGVAFVLGQMKAHTAAQGAMLDAFKDFNRQTIDALTERLRVGDGSFTRMGEKLQASELTVARLETGLQSHERQCADRWTATDGRFDRIDQRFNEVQATLQAMSRGEIRAITSLKPVM